MIEWKEEYSTGVSDLDEQHKSLFQYSNDLEEILKVGKMSKNTLSLALRYLEMYAKGHFSHEEGCMHKYSCPVAQKNITAHEEFIKKFNSFQEEAKVIGANTEKILKEIHRFLEGWLVGHICKIDVNLRACVH